MSQFFTAFAGVAVWLSFQITGAYSIDAQAVNAAEFSRNLPPKTKGLDPVVIRAQVILARVGFSSGEIDGRDGDNFRKAVRAFAAHHGLPYRNQLTPAIWTALLQKSSTPALIEHRITEDDVKGPFLEKVPTKMEEMQGLERLSYGSATEALAEKFHMSESLLSALNAKSSFEAGQTIVVANAPGRRRGYEGY